MGITPHILTSLLISTNVERLRFNFKVFRKRSLLIVSACILSFASHFVVDGIPHYDYSIYGSDSLFDFSGIFADFSLASAVFLFLFRSELKRISSALECPSDKPDKKLLKTNLGDLPFMFTLVMGAISSILPDILMVLLVPVGGTSMEYFKKFHQYFHSKLTVEMLLGLYLQFVAAFLAATLLYFSLKKLNFDKIGEEAEAWLAEEEPTAR